MNKTCPRCETAIDDAAASCHVCGTPYIREHDPLSKPKTERSVLELTNFLCQGVDLQSLAEECSLETVQEQPSRSKNSSKGSPPSSTEQNHFRQRGAQTTAVDSNTDQTLYATTEPPVVAKSKELFKLAKFKQLIEASVHSPLQSSRRTKTVAALTVAFLVFGAGGIILLNRQFSNPIVHNKASSISVPAGTYRFGGDPFYAAFNPSGLAALLQQEYPEFELLYREPIPGDEDFEKLGTSGWGIDSVIEQQLSFATSSRPVSDAEFNRAKNRGEELEQIPIAADATVFITNSGVGISGLSIEQLQKIFKGEAKNWKDFGGPDLPIRPIGEKVSSLAEMGLGGGQLGNNFEVAPSTTAMFCKILSKPGTIGFTSAALAEKTNQKAIAEDLITVLAVGAPDRPFVRPLTEDDGVHTQVIRDSSYPLVHSLFVVYCQGEEAGEAYVEILRSPQGRKILEDAGFVPVD